VRSNHTEQNIINNLWKSVFWISFPFGVLSFLLPIYGRDIGASALEIGGFFSAFSLVPAIIRPFLGRALDRWGRRPFLIIGLVGYLIATVVFSFASTVTMLTVARFLQGIGSAFMWIATFTMIADLAKKSGRGHNFGSIDEASYRGGIIGTTLGLTFVFTLQSATDWSFQKIWYWLFLIYLIPTAIGLFYGLKGTKETLPVYENPVQKSKPVSKQLLVLMGIVLLTGASQAMVWPLLMIFLQDHLGAGIASLAFAYLPAALISSFLPSRMGKLTDRWGRKGPMIIGLLVGAAASLAIPHLSSIIGLTVLWCLETIGYTISIPAERAFVADIAGEDIRGTSYGMYTFSFFLGAAIGPLAGGWLYDNVGKAMPFYLNTFVLIIGAILVGLALKESHPGQSNSELRLD
jgi:DHA1 family multidrug resistance protein-like MFS transporter